MRNIIVKVKNILLTALIVFSAVSSSQAQYTPSIHTTVSKPIGMPKNATDARSQFYEVGHFVYRDYVSTAEVLSYLTTANFRSGKFPIFVNSGGTLNTSTGVITGGTVTEYWFKDGVADGNLIVKLSGSGTTWSSITGTPTTLTGYGITDAYPLTGNPSAFLTSFTETDPTVPSYAKTLSAFSVIQTATDLLYRPISYVPAFSSITSKPTTISGYGITDAYPLVGNPSNFINALTGDITAAGPGSATATLATVNSNTGSFGTASNVPTITFNGKGLATSVTNTPIAITQSQVSGLVTDIAAKISVLIPTAIQTSNYTAASGELVLFNTASGTLTGTLPNAPPDGKIVAFKLIVGPSFLTINTSGGDVFNKVGGVTSITLKIVNQGILLQYQASTGVWIVLSDDLPLPGLDARYLQLGNNLSDLASVSTARTNLGLATVASTGAYSDLTGAPTNLSAFTNGPGYLTTIPASSVGISNLSATGTPSSTTFLRGDNTWQTVTAATPTLQAVATAGNSYTGQLQSGTFAVTNTTNGYVSLPTQTGKPTGVTGQLEIYRDSVGSFSYMNGLVRRTFRVPRAIDNTIMYPYRLNPTLADSTDLARLTQLGTIYQNNFWTTATLASHFTGTTASITVTGGKLVFTSSGILPINYISRIARWSMVDTIIIGTKNATANLIQVGQKGANVNSVQDSYVTYDVSTGANNGKIALVNGNGGGVTGGVIAASGGDTVIVSCARDQDYLIGSVTNITTKTGYQTLTYRYTSSAVSAMPNTDRFFTGITSANGMTIIGMSVTSTETVNSTLAIIGDSKTAGAFATNTWTSFARKIASYYPNTIILAGGSDRTQQILDAMPQLLSLKSKQVLLCAPAINDILGGISSATWQANYLSIISQLQAAGITVFTLDGIYDTSGSSQIYNWVNATLPSSMIIKTFMLGQRTNGALSGDNIHPTQIGNDVVANAVINSGKIKYGINTNIVNVTGNMAFIRDSIHVGNTANVGNNNPTFVDLGGDYSATQLSQTAYKLKIFNNGTLTAGIGTDAIGQYYGTYTGGVHRFAVNGSLIGTLGANITWLGSVSLGNTTPLSTSTPLSFNGGATYGSVAGSGSVLKVAVFDGGGASKSGLTQTASSLETHTYTGTTLDWFINSVRQMRVAAGGVLTLGVAGTTQGSVSFSGSTSGTISIAPQAAAGTYNLFLPNAAPAANGILVQNSGNTALTFLAAGSSNTVLHGGNTFSAVSLTTDITGVLPIANGGTGSSTNLLPIHGNSTTTGTATTTVTVTIPTQANNTYSVSIMPKDMLTAVNYYIDSATGQSTNSFTVTFLTALTGSINFDWTLNP